MLTAVITPKTEQWAIGQGRSYNRGSRNAWRTIWLHMQTGNAFISTTTIRTCLVKVNRYLIDFAPGPRYTLRHVHAYLRASKLTSFVSIEIEDGWMVFYTVWRRSRSYRYSPRHSYDSSCLRSCLYCDGCDVWAVFQCDDYCKEKMRYYLFVHAIGDFFVDLVVVSFGADSSVHHDIIPSCAKKTTCCTWTVCWLFL